MRIFKAIKENRSFFITASVITLLWTFLIFGTMWSLHTTRDNLISIETLREEGHYEGVLNAIFKKLEVIKVFTETNGIYEITDTEFDEFAEKTDFTGIGFVSVSIAPDGIIGFYYSEEYEDDLIGRDLVNDERDYVREAVAYAIENDVVVINGPYLLIHGGEGIVFRRAIFEDGDFVGIINLVVNSAMLNDAFMEDHSEVVDVGIYQTDDTMIFGSLEYSANHMILKTMDIENVDWRIGIAVNHDFANRYTHIDIILISLSSLLYIFGMYLGVKFYSKNKSLLVTQYNLIRFDNLTALPNRLHLQEDVENLISGNQPFYLGFGDLDNFKMINDIMGHSIGDEYLRHIADRFSNQIHDKLSIYRWGGDEFIFVVKCLEKEEAIEFFDRIYASLETPVKVRNVDYNISLSMGIVQYPRHGITMDDLIKRADIVMYDVKSHNKKTYNFFENRYLDSLQREVDFENKVNQFELDEYQVYLQPIVDVKNNEIYGFEGLTRLIDKNGKALNTIDVIRVLERQGRIPELDKHVFETICGYSKQLTDIFNRDFHFSFNVSPVSLSQDFVDYLAKKVKEHQLKPNQFMFEIIETIGFKDIDESVFLLKKLRDIGFQIAMDDFGMGYSSLSYITKLPLSVLKIDRYFINNYYDNEFDRLLIFAIRDISKSLKLDIVVEGIETSRQLDFIRSLGAHYYQGYIHSRPMSFEHLVDKLTNGFE